MKFYQAPTDLNIKGLIIALPIVIIAAALLGFIYNMLIGFIPFIYVNFLITIGLGLAMGFTCLLLFRPLKIRDQNTKMILAIVAGLAANFFQWVAFFTMLITGDYLNFQAFLSGIIPSLNPMFSFPLITEINEVGTWGILSFDFKGFPLAIIWLLEFGLIMLFPIRMIWNAIPLPFSENLQSWYPRYVLEEPFNAIYNGKNFAEELDKGVLEHLEKELGGGPSRHSKALVYFLPGAKEQFLSMETFIIEGQGTGKERSEMIVNNYTISTEIAKKILDRYQHIKDRVVFG